MMTTMLKRSFLSALPVLLLLLTAPDANASCVSCTCRVSTSGLAFGTYSPMAASPIDVSGSLRVECSLLGVVSLIVAYSIEISPGNSGSSGSRAMTGPGGTLRYNLYTTSQRTTVWGAGTSGTVPVSDSYLLGLLGVVRDYTVHGRIPAGQSVRPGTYVDNVIVTLSY